MYTQNVRAVLVESGEERHYSDGTSGRFITLLRDNDQLINAWLPGDVEASYGRIVEVQDVECFTEAEALSWKIALREWEGRTKRKIVGIGD